MINRVVLVGRLTRDPESRVTNSGKSVTEFSIAVSKRVKPQDNSSDADFFKVICWERTAEYAANYLHKGRLVAVDGRLQSRKYTASDGTNREVIEVVATDIQSLDRPREDNAGATAVVRMPTEPTAKASAAIPDTEEYDPFAAE